MSFGFGFALPAYPLRGGAGNNPFNQDGPTLDLSFVGTAGNLSGADTYTLNTDFITPEYQVAAQYAVWENGVGLAQKTFSQIVTFTRASTATYFNASGVLTSAAINEARFDYDPATLLARGFLIEEARTNSIRNNTMQGAVAGTPGTLPTNWQTLGAGLGTLTQTVVGTGTSAGINYIDVRINGTTSTTSFGISFETFTQIAAAVGQSWTSSVYLSRVGGTTTNLTVNLRVVDRDAGGGNLGNTIVDVTSTLGTTLSRFSLTRTLAGVGTAAVSNDVLFAFASGVAIDITLRIGLPQLELGAFATSVIPTTTTALTRSADVASVNTLSPWYNASEGTLYAEINIPQVNASIAWRAWEIDGPTTTQRLRNNTGPAFIYEYGTTGSITNAASITTGTTKAASAYAANDAALCVNAASVVTDSTVTIVTDFNRLTLGGSSLTLNREINGYLRRITYYPRRLANADLQTITA